MFKTLADLNKSILHLYTARRGKEGRKRFCWFLCWR